MNIEFTDACFVTNDVLRLRTFYETVFDDKAEGDEWHSTLKIGGLHIRLLSLDIKPHKEPTTHPWGARSFQFKDPDGNILNSRSRPKEERT